MRTLLLLALLSATAVAQDPPFSLPGTGPSKRLNLAEITVEPAAGPAGAERTLVITMFTDVGWHVYGSMEQVGTPPAVFLHDEGLATAAGAVVVPPGLPHESYGIESFWIEGEFVLRQTIALADDLADGEYTVTGQVDYTVCNEQICLPPDNIPFTVKLVVGAGAEGGSGDQEGSGEEAVLDDDAWIEEDHWYFEDEHEVGIFEATIDPSDPSPGDEMWLELKVKVADGFHVYGSKEETGEPPRLIFPELKAFEVVGDPVLPDGEAHDIGGLTSHWVVGGFLIRQKIRALDDLMNNAFDVEGELEYMACTDSTCLPFKKLSFSTYFSIQTAAPGDETNLDGSADGEGEVAAPAGDDDEGEPEEDDLFAFLLAAVAAGIFALSMPCTYPMIPITISFFTKQAEAKGGSALGLSLVYGLGIVLMFILIGCFLGPPIIKFAQQWWVNLLIGIVFVVFAFSLFGWFTLEPPKFMMNWVGKAQTKDGLIGVLLMGATLVVTSFTCSAPFVGTLLAFGASSGVDTTFAEKVTRVAMGMGVFGLTMAIPFVILSLLPGKASKMPKAGAWMNTAKVFFGFVELAAALKFFSNAELATGLYILPKWMFLGAWALLFGASGLFLMGAFGGAKAGNLQRAIGAIVLVFAHYCTWGAAGGKIDSAVMIPLAPPYDYFRTDSAEAVAEGHTIVEDDFEVAVQRAIDEKKILLVNFTGVT